MSNVVNYSCNKGPKNRGNAVQLIVRSTSRCNFNCTFCSASKLKGELLVDDIIQHIRDYQPIQSLIFEGGDPTCKSPDFYWNVLDRIEKESLNVETYGMTTNMWDFYKRPDKWVDLFKLPNMHVCTSFQYGNKRLIGKTVYTESMFTEVYDQFQKLVGKPLPFIAVIDQDNRDSVLKTVQLAKRLDTSCKINAAFEAGNQDVGYGLPDILEDYTMIINHGLEQYENNCMTIVDIIKKRNDSNNCPWMRNCNSSIRCVSPNNEVSTCSIENSWIDYKAPLNKNGERDMTLMSEGFVVKPQCLSCHLFDWCNQCRVAVMQAKHTPNFCERMQQVMPKLIEAANKVP